MTDPRFPEGELPKLLVSVRNAEEARAALDGGADIIDIKEPRNGSLGKADDLTVEEIIKTVRTWDVNRPLSVALGELIDWEESEPKPHCPAGVNFVKLGFSRCGSVPNWRERWGEFRRRLLETSPNSPEWVAVIYADWQTSGSPPPIDILDAATEVPCAAVLIDTFEKNGRSLVDILSPGELHAFAERVHPLGVPLALAGSLRVEDLSQLKPLTPEIIAIRSAACRENQRGGPVCASAVQNFRRHLVHG